MKNIIKYFGVAVLGCVAFSSCNNEQYLDVTHYTMLEGNAMFESDANAIKGMTGCYDQVLPRTCDDVYKYWIFNGQHPTLDSQASGWDKDFMEQKWTSEQEQLKTFWQQSYTCISRCNDFIAGLRESESVSEALKKTLEGEATCLRGFEFFGLANTFGRVPLLTTGETYVNTPTKARAKDYAEMWDFVIEDFKAAAELLNWEPYNGEYGRCTKGMALTFLGDAYMWKAYTCPDQASDCYQKAYDVFNNIIKNGPYELAPSFTTLYDADVAWPKEAIWQIVLNAGDQYGSWDTSKYANAKGWTGFYFAPTSNGAWGTFQMSWELYDSFENYNQASEDGVYYGSFDKRRDGSMVTATVPSQYWIKDHPRWQQNVKPTDEWLKVNAKYCRGYKQDANGNYVYDQATYDAYDWEEEAGNGQYDPQHPLGYNPFNQEYVGWCGYHWASADPAPTVWSTKHWRNGRGTDWSTGMLWLPDHIYFKRYANVLLDQAECCFRLGKTDEGWGYIDQIRNRAFGNLEVGKAAELTNTFSQHIQKVAEFYGDNDGKGYAVNLNGHSADYVGDYPFAFNTKAVQVPKAQEYYAKVKAEKGYTSEVWLVALGMERRKEFTAEPYLRSDLHKSGFLEDHVNHTYPKLGLPEVGASVIKEWRTARSFDFQMSKMFMPIPEDEIVKNSACDQNEGY